MNNRPKILIRFGLQSDRTPRDESWSYTCTFEGAGGEMNSAAIVTVRDLSRLQCNDASTSGRMEDDGALLRRRVGEPE